MPNVFLRGLRLRQLREARSGIIVEMHGEYDNEKRGELKRRQHEIEQEIERRVAYLQSVDGVTNAEAWCVEDGMPVKVKATGMQGVIVGEALAPDGETMVRVWVKGVDEPKNYWPYELKIMNLIK